MSNGQDRNVLMLIIRVLLAIALIGALLFAGWSV